MPAASRWMIRLSLVYLMVGLLLGGIMLVHKAVGLSPSVWMLLPVHIEVTIFGWIIQLTLGTAYWMLPRLIEGPSRGKPSLVVAMVISLNLGILLVLCDVVLTVGVPLRLPGRVLELVAVGLFVYLHWNRIVTYNK